MDAQEQTRIRESVDRAYALTEDALDWRPYYPNNMPQNGQEGWYCIIQGPNGEHARKYTIYFQHPENEDSAVCISEPVDRYVLFEQCYYDNDAFLAYPEPSEHFDLDAPGLDVNDFGHFVYAHKTLEQAKRRALKQYQMVFGYAMSHLLEEKETP